MDVYVLSQVEPGCTVVLGSFPSLREAKARATARQRKPVEWCEPDGIGIATWWIGRGDGYFVIGREHVQPEAA